jgi:undecaprenyl-phosphate galactose phosphotransferase
VLKRIFDVFLALILLVVLAPVVLALSLLLCIEGGSPIFAHERVGRGHRLFACYKFRTMLPDAERRLADLLANDMEARSEWEREYKLRNDPRVTSLGKFLRKTSLDELPQLWNVLLGDMSLVGPRPVVQDELARYGAAVDDYLSLRPGITGLWQVSGRNHTTYAERVAYDQYYARNWTPWLDVRILFRTVWVVIARDGAY